MKLNRALVRYIKFLEEFTSNITWRGVNLLMKICVLLSTYNGEKYLKEQLDSIIEQTVGKDIFIFIRDDGSCDGTKDILKEYCDKYDNILLEISKNIGCCRSFHLLVQMAPEADFYAFADQDDVWLPDKIERSINEIMLHDNWNNIPILYGARQIIVDKDLHIIRKENKDISNHFLDVMLKGKTIAGCTMVFNKKLRDVYLSGKNIPVEDETIYYHDSWMMKVAFLTGYMIYDKNAYILYRQHEDNLYGYGESNKKIMWNRIKSFDFTLRKYRTRNKTSRCAQALLNCYSDKAEKNNKELLYLLANCKYNICYRLKILIKYKMELKPFYEYMIYKLFIVLGWL